MIYLYLFGTCFHFIYVFMIIGNIHKLMKVKKHYITPQVIQCFLFLYFFYHKAAFPSFFAIFAW